MFDLNYQPIPILLIGTYIVLENFPNLKLQTGRPGAEKTFDLRPEAQYYVAESYINLKNYQKAIDFLLNYSSKYDSEENNHYRKLISERKSDAEVIDELPKSMDIELAILSSLSKSNDQKTAIREIPLQMRRFYIHAYQSYIFNKTLSMAFEYEEDLFTPQENDVCYDRTNKLGKFQNEPGQKLTIPLAGHSYFKKTRFDYYIQKTLEQEEISPPEFLIKDFQEISIEGGFRNSAIHCDDFHISNDTVEFQLPRGSYATIVIREILKPEDPLSCGF